ncbi:hypothetical protein DERF_000558 [Dermatophagoides farinae]|uniref:Uncharacterized protein n=1 Tax=Dermatophagoides farinae TaxID=6954 RepID=A0A922I7L2_DERFA|nr:hypothetical protein DERF_000558 [Dermatophagoides farinae]
MDLSSSSGKTDSKICRIRYSPSYNSLRDLIRKLNKATNQMEPDQSAISMFSIIRQLNLLNVKSQ